MTGPLVRAHGVPKHVTSLRMSLGPCIADVSHGQGGLVLWCRVGVLKVTLALLRQHSPVIFLHCPYLDWMPGLYSTHEMRQTVFPLLFSGLV